MADGARVAARWCRSATLGLIYLVSAAVTGGWFLLEAHALLARAAAGRDPRPMRLFHLSITYLTLLFLAIAIDQLV